MRDGDRALMTDREVLRTLAATVRAYIEVTPPPTRRTSPEERRLVEALTRAEDHLLFVDAWAG